jgi:hypothetical protein
MWTVTINQSWTDTISSGSLSSVVNIIGGTKVLCSEQINAFITNQPFAISFPFATLQAIVINSSQDLTLKFNSSVSPAPAISLSANEPLIWYNGCGLVNPFAVDVTTCYATNAGVGAADLEIRALII